MFTREFIQHLKPKDNAFIQGPPVPTMQTSVTYMNLSSNCLIGHCHYLQQLLKYQNIFHHLWALELLGENKGLRLSCRRFSEKNKHLKHLIFSGFCLNWGFLCCGEGKEGSYIIKTSLVFFYVGVFGMELYI